MFQFITKKISNKIIAALFVLMTISSLTIIFLTTATVKENSIKSTKANLEMLNSAMFQSLRNAMNSGDPAIINAAEEEAREIKGVSNLTVAKSKGLIEMYSPDAKYTQDKNILTTMNTKEEQIIETNENGIHSLRLIKPMVATQDCLLCHANQAQGEVIGVMDLTFSLEEADADLMNIILSILIVSTLLGWITLGIVFYVVRNATKPIDGLKKGFETLIQSNDSSIRLELTSKDEIGEVAVLFNTYMDKVNEGLKVDTQVIEEANDILEKTGNGFFVYKVQKRAHNPHVETMKNNLNNMIEQTKFTLDKINKTLRHYSESQFDFKIDDKGIYGDLGSVAAGIKLVGNNTSEILAMIMNTGDNLQNQTHALSDASQNLSTSSNQQAASLEETAAALEQITANIQANTQTTAQMAQLANSVNHSSSQGLKLADSTAIAMDEINEKVNSINHAIEVIDQIAFQTNILSLNAAVEAATAGEAGKGFAVVAQEVRNLASRSADAAKEIKDIVEQATSKANEGKIISKDMIDGYQDLKTHIEQTITMISQVADAGQEQERGIIQINDAVNLLDKETQQNAHVSDEISAMSTQIAKMSDSLVTAASRARYLQDARKEVCDIDLVYDTAKIKVDVLRLKEKLYSNLGNFEPWKIEKNKSMDDWMHDYVQSHEKVDMNTINNLTQLNNNLHAYMQDFVTANAQHKSNDELNSLAKKVEIESLRIFGTLNKLKKDACASN
ncbi:MAG: methyl-accepting chemotaxis protein [Campylobacterota bacterium]|nr:methyl-accepting chemotaxis protein [Campylobacterota bacterium]